MNFCLATLKDMFQEFLQDPQTVCQPISNIVFELSNFLMIVQTNRTFYKSSLELPHMIVRVAIRSADCDHLLPPSCLYS